MLSLSGEIGRSGPSEARILIPRTTEGPVTVDLAEVTFVDPFAIDLLLQLHRRAVDVGVVLHVTNASPDVFMTLQCSGLVALLDIAVAPSMPTA